MIAAVPAGTPAAMAPHLVPAVKPVALVRCRVVIKMPDGSRGEHTGLYPHSIDALNRALELFPEARVVSVAASRGRRAAR